MNWYDWFTLWFGRITLGGMMLIGSLTIAEFIIRISIKRFGFLNTFVAFLYCKQKRMDAAKLYDRLFEKREFELVVIDEITDEELAQKINGIDDIKPRRSAAEFRPWASKEQQQ